MIIFLGIVGELATIAGSVVISLKGSAKQIIEIGEEGYKFDPVELEKSSKKQAKNSTNKFLKVKGGILLFVPGVNLILSAMGASKIKKGLMSNPDAKNYLIPMTEEEKEQFAKLDNDDEKIKFLTRETRKKETIDVKEIIKTKEEPKQETTDRNKILNSWYDEKEKMVFLDEKKEMIFDVIGKTVEGEGYFVEKLGFSFDEVEKLNKAASIYYNNGLYYNSFYDKFIGKQEIEASCKFGRANGENIAVIGIPYETELPVNKISFLNGKEYAFDEITIEDAKDKTFTVYPFNSINNPFYFDTTLSTIKGRRKIEPEPVQEINEQPLKKTLKPKSSI